MNALEGLIQGFSVALTPENLIAALLACLIGTAVGVLPGIGPMGAMVLLLPFTVYLGPETAIIVLAAIYFGGMFGGSTSSILVNIPGDAANVATTAEGHGMARRGRAGAALFVAAVGSFVAGTLGIILLMLLAPELARLAVQFGAPEYFALSLLALIALSRISRGPLWKGLMALSFGLMVASTGMEPVTGTLRYTLGIVDLSQGIGVIPVVIGLYGIAEIFDIAERGGGIPRATKVRFRDLAPTKLEWRRSAPAMLRGSGIGMALGLVPGPGAIMSTFTSYRVEERLRRRKRRPDSEGEFGSGAVEGVAGPESGNNGATSAQLIPTLALGVPFSPAMAVLLAALTIQGVRPGPLLFVQSPDVFWGVVAAMYIATFVLLILNLPMVGVWVRLLAIPQPILVACILVVMFVGVYTVNNSAVDLFAAVVFGALGYVFRKRTIPREPIVLAVVLAPFLEEALLQSLFLSNGSVTIFFTRPISGTFMAIMLAVLTLPPAWRGVMALRRRRSEDE